MEKVRNKNRIVIAEDDPISRKVIATALQKRNFEVVVAKDGLEAWEILKKEDAPQLVILDWMMPEMDGVEVCRKVRHQKDKKYTYIIFLTAKGQKEDLFEGMAAGADDYVNKPFNIQELMARIKVGQRILGLENQLQSHIERLRELDNLKDDFISTVSHELRTPIAVMRGGISVCLEGVLGELNEKQQDILGDSLENIDRLNRLVTDLLDVSKIEAGKLSIRRSSIDICSLAKKIKRDFSQKVLEKNLQFKLDIPDKVLNIYADRDRVIQIFTNLVSNSIRYTNAGEVRLGIRDLEKYIKCWVSDTGRGIAKENLSRLFSKFEQFGRTEGPGYKGTGLGLTISKALVERHGGTIEVDSELGKGTTIYFTLKKSDFPTVMIVDDSERIVDIIKRFLAFKGFKSICAYDGKSALEKIKTRKPSIIILDIMLPEINGYEVLEQLNKEKINIPIIIMSGGKIDYKRLNNINGENILPVLEKPINHEKLVSKVEGMLVQE